jgi:ceramide glucosyltransferase
MSIFAAILALIGCLALAEIFRGHRRLARALARRAAPVPEASSYPSATVIRPIRGLDVGARENLIALLSTEYPAPLEILFVLDARSDPAFPLLQELERDFHGKGHPFRVLFSGAPPPGRTGKLNAMMLGVREAKGELIAFNDSDTRPQPQLLRKLVDALVADRGAGAVFAPIIASADESSSGDVGYGLLVNAWYGPSVALAAGSAGELPFIMGQFMVLRRQALDAIGGLACAEGQFVDDMYIGQCVARAGWRNRVVSHSLRVVTGGMGPLGFVRTFRRWILFSEGGLPAGFTRPNWVRGALAWATWLSIGLAFGLGVPAAAIPAALALIALIASQVALERQMQGPGVALRHLWIPAILPIVAGLVALSTRIWRRADWRGRSYALAPGARLGERQSVDSTRAA